MPYTKTLKKYFANMLRKKLMIVTFLKYWGRFTNEIEISKTTILKIEKGQLDPQLSTFCRIASALDISPSKLLSLVEKKLPKNWDFLDI